MLRANHRTAFALSLCAALALLSGCKSQSIQTYLCAGSTRESMRIGEKIFFDPEKNTPVNNILLEVPRESLKNRIITKGLASNIVILNGVPYAVHRDPIYIYRTFETGTEENFANSPLSKLETQIPTRSWWFRTEPAYIVFDQVGRRVFFMKKSMYKNGEVLISGDLSCEKFAL